MSYVNFVGALDGNRVKFEEEQRPEMKLTDVSRHAHFHFVFLDDSILSLRFSDLLVYQVASQQS